MYGWDGVQEGWVQLGRDIDGEANGDSSGSRLELTCDGRVIAVAASNNQSGKRQVRNAPVRWQSLDPGWTGYRWSTQQQRDVCGVVVFVDFMGMTSTITVATTKDSNAATIVNEVVVEEGYVEAQKKLS